MAGAPKRNKAISATAHRKTAARGAAPARKNDAKKKVGSKNPDERLAGVDIALKSLRGGVEWSKQAIKALREEIGGAKSAKQMIEELREEIKGLREELTESMNNHELLRDELSEIKSSHDWLSPVIRGYIKKEIVALPDRIRAEEAERSRAARKKRDRESSSGPSASSLGKI